MGLCRKAVCCRLRLDQAAALLGVGCLSREEAGQRVGRAGGKSGEAAGFHPWLTHTQLLGSLELIIQVEHKHFSGLAPELYVVA